MFSKILFLRKPSNSIEKFPESQTNAAKYIADIHSSNQISQQGKYSPNNKTPSNANINLMNQSSSDYIKSEYQINNLNKSNNQTSNDFSFFFPENDLKASFMQNSSVSKMDKAVQTSFESQESNLKKNNMRWIITVCDCIINIAKFYCMDSALALQTFFYSGNLSLTSTQYNLFYSIFAYFFILMFFAGYFIEKKGVRFSLFFFSFLCFVGHFLFTCGGTNENYALMLFGRLIFGIALYCLEICQDFILSEWFFNRELAFAVGLGFASCRLGSALTNLITPKIMVVASFFEALLIGLVLAFLGLVASIIIVIIDRNFEEEKGDIENMESFLRDFSFIENGISLKKLKELGSLFWILVVNAMFAYACYFGFINNSMDILCSLYGYSPQQAGYLVTIMFFSAALTPIFGFIIDRFGNRMNILIVLLILLSLPFISFCFLRVETSKCLVVVSLIFIGFFFSSYAAVLWSSFPLIIEGKMKCMAFAIIYASLNISLILSSVFVGVSLDFSQGLGESKYYYAFVSMIICLVFSFCLVVKINFNQHKKILALNSFVTNQEIREIINEDPDLGAQLLEMIEETEKEIEMEQIKIKI